MTADEVRKIAKIMCSTDRECFVCAAKLLDDFAKAFPEYEAAMQTVYHEQHGKEMSFHDVAKGNF